MMSEILELKYSAIDHIKRYTKNIIYFNNKLQLDSVSELILKATKSCNFGNFLTLRDPDNHGATL
jgi:hypothetical protein